MERIARHITACTLFYDMVIELAGAISDGTDLNATSTRKRSPFGIVRKFDFSVRMEQKIELTEILPVSIAVCIGVRIMRQLRNRFAGSVAVNACRPALLVEFKYGVDNDYETREQTRKWPRHHSYTVSTWCSHSCGRVRGNYIRNDREVHERSDETRNSRDTCDFVVRSLFFSLYSLTHASLHTEKYRERVKLSGPTDGFCEKFHV